MTVDWKTLLASSALSVGTAVTSYFGSRIYTDRQLVPTKNVSIIPLHVQKAEICRFDPARFSSKLQELGNEISGLGAGQDGNPRDKGVGAEVINNPRYILFTQLSALYSDLAPHVREYQAAETSASTSGPVVPLDAKLLKQEDSSELLGFLESNHIAECPTDASRAIIEVSAVITMRNVETYTLWRTCELLIDEARKPLKVRLEKLGTDQRADINDTVEIIKDTTKVRLVYDARFKSSTPEDAFESYMSLIDEAAKGPKGTRREYGLSIHCSAFGRDHHLTDADIPTKCRFRDNDFDDCGGIV